MKLGYGPTCYKKYLSEEKKFSLDISSASLMKSWMWFSGIHYRNEGLVNCAKVFFRTSVKPTLTIREDPRDSYWGAYSEYNDKIEVKTKFRDQFDRIETYIHELIHSTEHKTRLNRTIGTYEQIGDSVINVKEEMIAELGTFLFLKKCGVFMSKLAENRFLDHQLARIRTIHLDKLSKYGQICYISSLERMYEEAQRAVNYIFGGL